MTIERYADAAGRGVVVAMRAIFFVFAIPIMLPFALIGFAAEKWRMR